ncbi:hypothetical protein AVEN_17163-1 [Araneus ventricosus]|uniref:Uncharacterized protein n=1 Tax=Araneus ventricosus TaxID=182803 RepID=A0A4Y2UKE2_ARAVE|nr:hypothetical protein AVEN_17163-1 [Araneus ventricosus]
MHSLFFIEIAFPSLYIKNVDVVQIHQPFPICVIREFLQPECALPPPLSYTNTMRRACLKWRSTVKEAENAFGPFSRLGPTLVQLHFDVTYQTSFIFVIVFQNYSVPKHTQTYRAPT